MASDPPHRRIWSRYPTEWLRVRECVTVARHVSGTNDARPCVLTPTCGTLVCAAGLAQLVEQLSCKQQVIGSSPIAGSEESVVRH